MKDLIMTSVAALFINLGSFAQINDSAAADFSRDLRFEVSGKYTPVTKEKLTGAQSLDDIILYYPTNWITDYISVEISATCKGKFMKARGENNILSTLQKNIVNTIDLGSDLFIIVEYNNLNSITNTVKKSSMNVSMTVVPEKEAEFVTGKYELMNYLKKNACDKISNTVLRDFQQAIVFFTVNEEGEITDVKIPLSSGDMGTDKLLLDAINNMPKWNSAENGKGIKVRQEFKFSLNKGGC